MSGSADRDSPEDVARRECSQPSCMKFRFVLLGPDDDPDGRRLAQEAAARVPPGRLRTLQYEQRKSDMVRVEQRENGGLKSTVVANFNARIVRDIILDDGEEQRRHFGVEAELGGARLAFSVSAAEFGGMGWVLDKLGPQAIIYPGQRQHARAAIQWLSGEIPQEHIFAHLGWRKHGPHWVYLHAGGALGASGPLSGLQVQVPAALQSYQVRSLKDPDAQVRAVRASLRCLSLAPDRITFSLLAAVYWAPFGRVDFSIFLTGKTGVFKTALAALCQQHFGAAMDATSLPANFASTGNALEGLAFHAKDALLVVDDFAPIGRQGDGELHQVAERLFRAAGNQQGRSRLGGNGLPSAPKPPRALVLATGEEVPPGQSIRARLLVVEVAPGEVDRATLSDCQRAGQEGRLAESMGAFLSWVAGHYEERQQCLQARMLQIRSQGHGRAVHARLPATLAELQGGWEQFLEFALEVGAIGRAEKEELEERSQRAFAQLCALQAKYQEANDPALRFVALLQAALAGGRAHLADRRGRAPDEAAAWGWQRKPTGRGWAPRGTRIGWVGGGDLFLEPAASYQVAQEVAGVERLPVSEQILRHRLRERGLLASTDIGRQMVQVRRTLEGGPRQVLHLKASALVELPPQASRTLSFQPKGRH
jgi:hypothetical protein